MPDLVILIEGSDFAFKTWVHLWCIHYHLVDMILIAPTKNTAYECKSSTLDQKVEACFEVNKPRRKRVRGGEIS